MQEFYNLRSFIQHLIDQNEYQDDDDEWTNPLSESNWIFQTHQFAYFIYYSSQDKLKNSRITRIHQVHLTENDAQHTFKAPCCCFENAPNTDLLFFEQSMRVLIVG